VEPLFQPPIRKYILDNAGIFPARLLHQTEQSNVKLEPYDLETRQTQSVKFV